MILTWIYLAFILGSAIMAIVWNKYLKSRNLLIFIPYLILVFIQELVLTVYTFNCINCNTQLVYHISRPLTSVFFYLFFYPIPFNKRSRNLLFWIVLTYILITIVTLSFFQSLYSSNPYLISARSLVVTFCGLFTLFNYFTLNSDTEEKYWLPVLWICVGFVIFYPVINIAFSFHAKLLSLNAKIFGKKLYQIIPQIMSIFMYSCFIYAFYLCKKKN